ncbi:MAG: glycosyltransferase [Xanthomonadales bacterium]|nr:glycosyltransferase [Xanthomonadales bacterium]
MAAVANTVSVIGPTHDKITLSVVSHGQARLIAMLFQDLEKHCGSAVEVTLTLNLPESLPFDPSAMPFKVRVIENPRPKGFGDNHNAAFASGCAGFFCVLNPDIRLLNNPFPALTEALGNPRVGVVAPLILDSQKTVADSARKFPTVISILGKVFRKKTSPDYAITDQLLFPDWVAGMFMLFRRDVYDELHGFDKNYFLYYEDADLCARLRLAGYLTALCPGVSAIHDAQRESHRKFRYLKWHLRSMLRFFALSARRKISPGRSKTM